MEPTAEADVSQLSTPLSVDMIFFDFDGTLVQSVDAKRRAFFRLFPDEPEYRSIVEQTLREDPDGSRHVVIPLMIERIRAAGLALPADLAAGERITTYTDLARREVSSCPETPGATGLLRALHGRCSVFICSNTPQRDLEDEINARDWSGAVEAVYGYPNEKREVIAGVLDRCGTDPLRALVVGDGVSDHAAAAVNRCGFVGISSSGDLIALAALLGVGLV
jgi:phosphoglycolate phosphatase-like HAD superfamily hydrolase